MYIYCSQKFKLFGISRRSILSVPDEGYSRNASCALNISTFLFCDVKHRVRTIMQWINRGCRGRYRVVVWFTTTYAISAYHHWCDEFESRWGRGVHHYVIKFNSYLRQVNGFLRVLRFPPPIKLTATISLKYCWRCR